MKKSIYLLSSILLLNNFCAYANDKMKTNKNQFPQISGKNLEDKEYNLPKSFEGKYNLVFVAFLREQQNDVNKWIPLANSLIKKYEKLNYYELPVLSENYNLARWFIDGGMKAGIPDKSAREKTITIYTNKSKFLEVLDISEDNNIHILLLDDEGKILWRNKGTFSKEKADSLENVLAQQNK